jgi:Fe2+ or Zn2+ uptake regulation protein
MIEFQVSGIDSIIREAASQHGFQAASHSFIVQGTCSACRQRRVAQRRLDRI